MEARYIVDENRERVSVILPIEEYERPIAELEELKMAGRQTWCALPLHAERTNSSRTSRLE